MGTRREQHRWVWVLLPWIFLAVVSVAQYPRFFLGQCAIHTSWLLCDATLSVLQQGAVIAGAVLFFLGLGWASYQWWQQPSSHTPAITTLLVIAALSIVPFASKDMMYYLGSGTAALQEGNPFVDSWERPEPFTYGGTVSQGNYFVYGPIMAHIFHAVVTITGTDPHVFMIGWRVLQLGILVGVGACLSLFFPSERPSFIPWLQSRPWLILALPLFSFEALVSGHFDGMWVVTLLGALYAAERRWWVTSIALLTTGIWMKFVPLFAVPWVALYWWQETRGEWRERVRTIGWGACVAAIITVVSWASYWEGIAVFRSIALQTKWAISSVFAVLYYSIRPGVDMLVGGDTHYYVTRGVQGALALLVVYLLFPLIRTAVAVLRGKKIVSFDTVIGAIVLTYLIYLMVWQKSFWPWYVTWFIPLGLVWYGRTGVAWVRSLLIYLSIAPLCFYPVWAIGWFVFGDDPGTHLWFWYYVVLSVWGYPALLVLRARRQAFASTLTQESSSREVIGNLSI